MLFREAVKRNQSLCFSAESLYFSGEPVPGSL